MVSIDKNARRPQTKETDMASGNTIIMAKRGQYPEYLMQVFESTNQLFFLPEAVRAVGGE